MPEPVQGRDREGQWCREVRSREGLNPQPSVSVNSLIITTAC